MTTIMDVRRAGVLLHISSLPCETGLGDFGGAKTFIDYLVAAGISVWQVLPLGPTHGDLSPYQCTSSLAGNPMFIDISRLRDAGWLAETTNNEQYEDSQHYRAACLRAGFQGFKNNTDNKIQQAYQTFVNTHTSWLNDFALFTSLWRSFGPWMSWPQPLRDYNQEALAELADDYADAIAQVKFEQFVFYQQWFEIKTYANKKGVLIFGDVPLYIAQDSAEVWANRQFFKVDEHGNAEVVAGVPPDYFSETGQVWGNPVYNWCTLQQHHFSWWVQRLKTQFELFDLLRIDHFRGLQAYWEIPAGADNASSGNWQDCPGYELLETLQRTLGELPIVAEDLGFITDEVHQLREHFAIPGMKVVQFAFDGSPDNPYLLRHHLPRCVVYTGTHDNDTSLAWYESLPESTRVIVDQQLQEFSEPMPWSLINYTLSSPALLVMIPMQDLLGLGQGHRLNTPGTVNGNWRWQMQQTQLTDNLADHIRSRLSEYQRLVQTSNISSGAHNGASPNKS